jgi:hypothetical protein
MPLKGKTENGENVKSKRMRRDERKMYDKKVSKFVIIYERGEQHKGKGHSGSR